MAAPWVAKVRSVLERPGPVLIMLAGSNGAGKTTFYRRYLAPVGIPFVNADEIARALFPNSPVDKSYEAMLIAEQLRTDLVERRETFCMETVLSDTQGAKLRFLQQARDAGYRVVVVFIRLASPQLSQARVHTRVRKGGHNVPTEKLLARFARTLANAEKALAIADLGVMVDNSLARQPYRWIETWENGACIERAPA